MPTTRSKKSYSSSHGTESQLEPKKIKAATKKQTEEISEPSAPGSLSQLLPAVELRGHAYRNEISMSSATLHGLKKQCELITVRSGVISEKYQLNTNQTSTSLLSENLTELSKIPGFGLYGKIGMIVKRETAERLESVLKAMDLMEEEEQALTENIASEGLEMDAELTPEIVHDTLEGIDHDLLGVDSQAALDKLSNLVEKTIKDNHPGKGRIVDPPEMGPSLSQPPSACRAPPLKFAFISVVATYDAKCHVPLEDLHSQIRSANFDPQWFHSVVLTFPFSECRVSIFENGKFVITGVTTIKMALVAARNVLEILKICGYRPEISKRNFRAKNLTAMMDLGVNLDIAGFAEKNPGNTYLDQDTFGAVTHLPEKNSGSVHKGGLGMCFLIFATGKIVMVGGKTEKHMISVFRDRTLALLKPFSFGWL